jgi:hypothetical protein
VDTRPRLGAPKGNNAPDLREGEPQPASPRHEVQHVEHVLGIDAVTRWGTAGRREDTASLIQTERLAAQSAARGDLADQ